LSINETHTHEEDACCKTHNKKTIWYRSPFSWVLIGCGILTGVSYFWQPLSGYRSALENYVRMLWLPVTAGFFLGGLVDRFVPETYISKHLAEPGKKTVFYAVSLGFLMSSCCHGLVALAMELHRKGASGAAVVSFLLASPWASLPVTLMLIGLFGAKAFLIIFAALFMAVTTGIIFQGLDRAGLIERNRHTVRVETGFSIRKDVGRRVRGYHFSFAGLGSDLAGILRGTLSLAQMVSGWVFLGLVMASLSNAFIPTEWFHRFLGPSIPGLFGTLLFATVLEVCSEGTSPVAFEIYKQTHAFGNALVFLMGGVVTDYTEIGLIWQNIGPKTALWVLIVTLPQVLLFGWLFNQFHFH